MRRPRRGGRMDERPLRRFPRRVGGGPGLGADAGVPLRAGASGIRSRRRGLGLELVIHGSCKGYAPPGRPACRLRAHSSGHWISRPPPRLDRRQGV